MEDRILSTLEDELRLTFQGAAETPGAAETVEALRKREKVLETALERQADAYEAGIYTLDDYAARSTRTRVVRSCPLVSGLVRSCPV